MNRKIFAAVIAAIFFLTTTVSAHIRHIKGVEQQQEVNIKTIKVNGSIYMLEGQGGNIGVSAGEDGIVMIDTQFAPLAPKIKAALKALGSEKPKFVLNTHWHGDHTGGNAEFGADSIIIAHLNVRKRMSVENVLQGRTVPAAPRVALPGITFEQSISLYMNGEEVRLVHFPKGHTDGDTVVFFTKSNVVHLGDDFFAGRFPFVDLNSGGSVQGLTANLTSLIGQIPADAKLIPGHGPVSTLDDLKTYRQTIVETTEIVRRGITGGKNLEQLKKEGLPAKYASWGTGFIKTDRWIETIFNSYSKQT
ncbi:MAG: MBL fold metallo-hydrolase [Acidobacteriota bacterium]|nr:MBL fold metallo-hydrolase [Acidobacteriota bacterium]